jgi:hypothetical protein
MRSALAPAARFELRRRSLPHLKNAGLRHLRFFWPSPPNHQVERSRSPDRRRRAARHEPTRVHRKIIANLEEPVALVAANSRINQRVTLPLRHGSKDLPPRPRSSPSGRVFHFEEHCFCTNGYYGLAGAIAEGIPRLGPGSTFG